jgi:hypothetical protein
MTHTATNLTSHPSLRVDRIGERTPPTRSQTHFAFSSSPLHAARKAAPNAAADSQRMDIDPRPSVAIALCILFVAAATLVNNDLQEAVIWLASFGALNASIGAGVIGCFKYLLERSFLFTGRRQ